MERLFVALMDDTTCERVASKLDDADFADRVYREES